MFLILAGAAALFGGAVAAVAGFGIGSLLTPVLTVRYGANLAVAAVSLPHLLGTAVRFWRMRDRVEWPVVRSFGLMSAAGGLTGAVLNTRASGRALEIVFGSLLLLAGASQLTGAASRWRLRGRLAWLGGAASGFFGGLVGNQGGIRTAAMLGFELDKRQFVATTTAVALVIDLVRVPVYLAVHFSALAALAVPLAVAGAGVLAGTLAGQQLLERVPQQRFRLIIGALLVFLGISFFFGYQ